MVTDAGTPGISDPGEEIVKEAINNNVEIIPIPGACALISGLICSGLNTKEFSFYGFLPLNKKNREKVLDKIKMENKTVIMYEAPHKLIKTLNDILLNIGEVNCVIAKELTKIHEEFIRDKISNIISELDKKEAIKGEYVILLDLNGNEIIDSDVISMKTVEEQYKIYESQGMNKKDIIKQIAKNKNVQKNEIYKIFINK